jgi:hypothetical protein
VKNCNLNKIGNLSENECYLYVMPYTSVTTNSQATKVTATLILVLCVFLYQILYLEKLKKNRQESHNFLICYVCVSLYVNKHSAGNDNGCSTHLYWNAMRDVT